MPRTLKTGLLLAVAAVSLTACSAHKSSSTATPATATPSATSSVASATTSKRARIMAAAEPFENLTEQAQGATATRLSSLIGKADNAAKSVSPLLDNAQQGRLDSHLDDIQAAYEGNDRTSIALAAVEGYRSLVESASDTGPVPRAVSLLDYSGFRYQADLAASPTRWQDASAALDFADTQWADVGPKVTDKALHRDFADALTRLRKATKAKRASLARAAVTHELDMVDQLESYFNRKNAH